MDKKTFRKKIKLRRNDLERPLRVVKYLQFPYILNDSPVELEEAYIVSDTDSWDVFATIVFKNISTEPIRELKIKIACYLNQNIPYTYIEHTYCQDDLTFGLISKDNNDYKLSECYKREMIFPGETFGKYVLIPIPEAYFSKMDIIIDSALYCSYEREQLNIHVAGRSGKFSDLDNISKLVYTRVNLYQEAEYVFPTVVIPQFGERGWMCCCGNKNSNSSAVCTKCGREREWQKLNIAEKALEKTKNELVSDPTERTLHEKSAFKQNKYIENKQDLDNKIKRYEEAMNNIAKNQLAKKVKAKKTFVKLCLLLALMMLLIVVFGIINDFRKGQFKLEGCDVVKTSDNAENNENA